MLACVACTHKNRFLWPSDRDSLVHAHTHKPHSTRSQSSRRSGSSCTSVAGETDSAALGPANRWSMIRESLPPPPPPQAAVVYPPPRPPPTGRSQHPQFLEAPAVAACCPLLPPPTWLRLQVGAWPAWPHSSRPSSSGQPEGQQLPVSLLKTREKTHEGLWCHFTPGDRRPGENTFLPPPSRKCTAA